MAETEFNISAYEILLRQFLELGYRTVSYDTVESQKRHIILRHDLDMSIQAAVPVAQVERKLGLIASYFVLLRTEMYNPFSKRNRDDLLALIDLGHDVGLHFDTSLYQDDAEMLENAVEVECQSLENLLQRRVSVISFHRPAKSLLGKRGSIAGRMQTYQPEFFEEIGYCSDSRGGWHFGPPLSNKAIVERRAMQLLTHPVWWCAPGENAVEKLDWFVGQKQELLQYELALNCEPYREVFKGELPSLSSLGRNS